MDEKIETVARALCAFDHRGDQSVWEKGEGIRNYWRGYATVAIEAIDHDKRMLELQIEAAQKT